MHTNQPAEAGTPPPTPTTKEANNENEEGKTTKRALFAATSADPKKQKDEDDVRRISTSIFVTNFPEEFKARDLWRICTQYGTVIDAFIPNRRSKSGYRFCFVRFIKIKDVNRVVSNLCTIWVGRLKLHANIARFQRTPLNNVNLKANSNVGKSNVMGGTQKEMGVHGHLISFAQMVKRGHLPTTVAVDQKPALVLDDLCTLHMDFSLSVVGKLKEFALLPNFKSTLAEEGFDDIIIRVPVCAWSQNTFARIASKWGSLLHDVDEETAFFHRKRLWWTPDLDKCDKAFNDSDNESLGVNSEEIKSKANSEVDSDVKEILKTIFEQGDQDGFKSKVTLEKSNDVQEEIQSADPFNIYELLKKKKPSPNVSQQPEGEPKYPSGFTPKDVSEVSSNTEHEEVNAPKVNHEEENVLKAKKKDHKPTSKEEIEDSVGSGHFKSAGATLCINYFIAIMGKWVQSDKNMLIISVYAPHELGEKKMLWQYLNHLIDRYKGEVIVMGDFNEVRTQKERFGSIFNVKGAAAFNSFISSRGLVEVPFGGYSFTWSHKSASKMSKLDRFLISEGLMRYCPNISAITLDRHLSANRPIVLCEINFDYGPTPFCFYHYWFEIDGFDSFVANTWRSINILDFNPMSRLLNKLRQLKKEIRSWVKDNKEKNKNEKQNLKTMLADIDLSLDKGVLSSDILEKRINIMHKLTDLEKKVSLELAQKAKIKWSIEGDENSKYFHGIINKHRSNLAIRGILVDGAWIEDPSSVKNEFLNHFKDRFQKPSSSRLILDMEFPNKLSLEQRDELERPFTKEKIKGAVWDCGLNKSPGPDGFTFGFYRRYWSLIESDVVDAANYFYAHGPISLIGSLYKIITKILANRLVSVLGDLVNEVQSAFIENRQILDGPFILNELIHWCKAKKNQTMIFKVDFEKAFDSVRWDFLDDVLKKFEFGDRWCHWIQSCLSSSRGSILVNGSPISEFQLVMESLHKGLFKGVVLDNSLQISHLFYADDVVFVGKWRDSNINTNVHVLDCFFRASGLRINMHKSMIMGVAVENTKVTLAAANIGCMILKAPFNYLGVKVGGRTSRISFWDESTNKLLSRLSKWKMKTLSIGGRLTLLKLVLGSLPIYYMSMFKVPLQVLKKMESIRSHFFNGVELNNKKMSLIKWDNVLASKENGGLGISSFFSLNRALIFKWVWQFCTQKSSFWTRVITTIFGLDGKLQCSQKACYSSNWMDIVREVSRLHKKGMDLLGFIKKKVGNGENTLFWEESWKDDIPFKSLYPRLFALESDKKITVAAKLINSDLCSSLRRMPRSGWNISSLWVYVQKWRA
ncbi:RNA-directed DNA polymerase, eukaryota [Tanacetum coccineum]